MAASLARVFRLWGLYARLDLIWVLRDFRWFVRWTVAALVTALGGVAAALLLAERFGGIGEWSKLQVVFLLGYGLLVSGLLGTFFDYNVLYISRRLGRGQLDHTLIQPQPIWMSLLTDGFAPLSGSGSLLPGVGLLAWAITGLGLRITPVWLTLFGVSVFASTVVVLSFSVIWGSLAFRAPRAAEEISTSAMRIMDEIRVFPLDGVGAVLTGSLLSVLPVGFVAWLPCRVLLGLDTGDPAAWMTPGAGLIMGTVATMVFLAGIRYYFRNGSQRYDALGHRG